MRVNLVLLLLGFQFVLSFTSSTNAAATRSLRTNKKIHAKNTRNSVASQPSDNAVGPDQCVPNPGNQASYVESYIDANGAYIICKPPEKPDASAAAVVQANGAAQKIAKICMSELKGIISKCEADKASTVVECDEGQDKGISEWKNMAKQAVLGAGQMGSTQAACSKMQTLGGAANAALAFWDKKCTDSRMACAQVCKDIDDQAKACIAQEVAKQQKLSTSSASEALMLSVLNDNVDEDALQIMLDNHNWQESQQVCDSYVAKQVLANQAMNTAIADATAAFNCQKQTSGTPNGLLGGLELCKQYPTLPNCLAQLKQDCSNPAFAQSNPVCVCVKSPSDPICNSNQKPSVSMNQNGGVHAGPATKPNGGLDPNLDGMGGAVDGITPMALSAGSGATAEVGGKQGGSANLGAANGGAGGKQEPGAGGGGAEPTEPTQVNAGYVGAGGGGFGGGGGYQGSRSGSGAGGNDRGPGSEKNPDLSKFLPHGYRGSAMASMGGVSPLLGPHVNIWERIHNRYEAVRSTLAP